MTARLEGMAFLVTGSTGIAAAAAEMAAREGARVFVVSKTEANCRALAERLRAAGAESEWLAGDLADAKTSEEAVQRCVAAWGRLDAVFNVAGGSGRSFGDGPLHECTDDGWRATMEMNATSMFFACRAALRQMLAQEPEAGRGRGAILNMSSVLATSPQGTHFATHSYAASKGAILSMTKAMAAYYAPMKIRVNAIAPALVKTPMSKRAQGDDAILEMMKTKQPLAEGLIGAEAVAKAAIYLLSPDASMVTGEAMNVDAGWSVSG